MQFRTYLVTAADLSAGRSTPEIVAAALAGGVDVVQLREKSMSARERLHVGEELRALTREAGAPLIVNDRVDIATALDADGVHLGDDDLPIAVAREQLGEDAIIGRSVSTVEDAQAAEQAGADYLGVGAVFTTDSKQTDPDSSDIGLDRIRAIDDAVDIPFVGIGGVGTENAASVAAAGADGVAVISAITEAADPGSATETLRTAVETGRQRR